MDDETRPPPLRVLVVDDCPDGLQSTALLVRLWGHVAVTATDGPTALQRAAACRPDVVLLDVGLPGMDGHAVARALRGRLGLGQAYLICVTGYAAEEDRRLALAAGCDEHWAKPVDPEALRRLLESRRRVRDQQATKPAPEEAAEVRLRRNPYLALRNLSCDCINGVLTLRGRLTSYYLKQMALAAVAGVEGVDCVRNEIEVVAPAHPG